MERKNEISIEQLLSNEVQSTDTLDDNKNVNDVQTDKENEDFNYLDETDEDIVDQIIENEDYDEYETIDDSENNYFQDTTTDEYQIDFQEEGSMETEEIIDEEFSDNHIINEYLDYCKTLELENSITFDELSILLEKNITDKTNESCDKFSKLSKEVYTKYPDKKNNIFEIERIILSEFGELAMFDDDDLVWINDVIGENEDYVVEITDDDEYVTEEELSELLKSDEDDESNNLEDRETVVEAIDLDANELATDDEQIGEVIIDDKANDKLAESVVNETDDKQLKDYVDKVNSDLYPYKKIIDDKLLELIDSKSKFEYVKQYFVTNKFPVRHRNEFIAEIAKEFPNITPDYAYKYLLYKRIMSDFTLKTFLNNNGVHIDTWNRLRYKNNLDTSAVSANEVTKFKQIEETLKDKKELIKATRIEPEKFKTFFDLNKKNDIDNPFLPEKEDLESLFNKSPFKQLIDYLMNETVESEPIKYLVSYHIICTPKTRYEYIIDFDCGIRIIYIDIENKNGNVHFNPEFVSSINPFSYNQHQDSFAVLFIYSDTVKYNSIQLINTLKKYILTKLGKYPDFKLVNIFENNVRMYLTNKEIIDRFEFNPDSMSIGSSLSAIPKPYNLSIGLVTVHENKMYNKKQPDNAIYSTPDFSTYMYASARIIVEQVGGKVEKATKEELYRGDVKVQYHITQITEIMHCIPIDLFDSLVAAIYQEHIKKYGSHVQFNIIYEYNQGVITPYSIASLLSSNSIFIPFTYNVTKFNLTKEYFIPNDRRDNTARYEKGRLDSRWIQTPNNILTIFAHKRNIIQNLPNPQRDRNAFIEKFKKSISLFTCDVPCVIPFIIDSQYIKNIISSDVNKKLIEIEEPNHINDPNSALMFKVNTEIRRLAFNKENKLKNDKGLNYIEVGDAISNIIDVIMGN